MELRPTIQQFTRLRKTKPSDLLDRAYRAMFFNRTTHGGRAEAGPMGGWEQQKKAKLHDRWNAKRIIREMHDARSLLHGRTTVLNEDFATVIARADAGSFIYCDPPYVKAGNGLYVGKWTGEDHVRLRDALRSRSNWVLSYDQHPLVVDL